MWKEVPQAKGICTGKVAINYFNFIFTYLHWLVANTLDSAGLAQTSQGILALQYMKKGQ